MITLPIQEAKKGKIDLLLDSGATLTLIKVGNLKEKTMVQEEKLALIGVTGHQIHTTGKIKATLDLGNKKIRHTMYVVKDDFPIEYEGILGNDFLTRHKADISNTSKQLKIAVIIPSDVTPVEFKCPISVLNVTDKPVEILTPHVTLEDMPVNDSADVLTLHATEERESVTARHEKLREQLQTEHLNDEERKERASERDAISRPYRLPEKHRAKVKRQIQKMLDDRISPNPSKLQAVKEFPTPRKVKDIQSFFGLAGYYRIENFSKIAKPLTRLTKKGKKFNWSVEQQNAFDLLKEKLTTAPVLNYPDFDKEFLMTTDASDYAIGAVLSQEPVGQDRPIAYASR
ncbi:uncharacterized protein LOC112455126, partial [Temnothorax curvispinosus]|uniref:RNA-directed DNA polymerase n=1 Tax=Temnothorax curvispinosus TaxID=300111 RepID=A0A6J1PSB4_9HYME